ncbi:MFS transporter [Rhodopila sp.]|uniref:MFS transporter n=1 Tax=Rhodopila sp. TaxID=2480087 RepID=UPI002CA4414D|nr:MFS transporter [Rhodopila sp.]HVZ07464.1 MFS transporter [Rhodopila sp.]
MSVTGTTGPSGAASLRAHSHVRLIAACTIGNALEFYDFVVFSFFARTIGALFFPAQDPTAQLLLAFATYGVGFFLRPLGGLVLGAYADRKGRKTATLLTLALMALGTCMIGLAPAHATSGLTGASIVLLGRLLQGFSAGGEVGASTTLLAEHAPSHRRGFFGSWQLASQGLGVTAAAVVAFAITTMLPPADVTAWGWRLAFLLGALIVPVGLWLRVALEESHANEADMRTRSVSSLRIAVKQFPGRILAGVGLVVGGTAANAIIVLYMATYAVTQLHLPPQAGLLAGIAGGLANVIVAPLGGALSDRVGRKPVILISYLLLVVAIHPAFLALNASPSVNTLLWIIGGLSALNTLGAATVILTLPEIFPVEARATGMSLVYALGVAIFGGFGQFIVTWLIQTTGNPLAAAWYVMACAAATVIALAAIPEMRGHKLV